MPKPAESVLGTRRIINHECLSLGKYRILDAKSSGFDSHETQQISRPTTVSTCATYRLGRKVHAKFPVRVGNRVIGGGKKNIANNCTRMFTHGNNNYIMSDWLSGVRSYDRVVEPHYVVIAHVLLSCVFEHGRRYATLSTCIHQ